MEAILACHPALSTNLKLFENAMCNFHRRLPFVNCFHYFNVGVISRFLEILERFRDRQTTNTCGGEPYSYTLTFGSATDILTKQIRIRISLQCRRAGETCSTEATQGPEATQPYSTCVQAHSRSLRKHFTAEFAPFFHSRKVNS